MPAAWLPDLHLHVLVCALEEVAASRRVDRCSASLLQLAAEELVRHRGSGGEPCIVTRDAVFGIAGRLDEAGSRLSLRGRQAGALVAFAVRDRLMDAITDSQPVAPS